MGFYQQTILDAKDRMTQVVPLLDDPDPQYPVSRLEELEVYLKANDCTKAENMTECYRLTRLKLIHTTNDLDKANARIYAGQVTINSLIDNMNVIVDGLTATLEPAK